MKDEVYFWHTDKHGSLLQVVTKHFSCVQSSMPKVPKTTSLLFLCNILIKTWVMKLIFYMRISTKACWKLIIKFLMSLQYLKKKVRDEVDFWINFKAFCKLILALWPSTFPRKWYYHWYSWSSILKLLKVKTLHYLYNITKKKWVAFIFCMRIKIKTSTSSHCRVLWKWPDMSKVPNRGW